MGASSFANIGMRECRHNMQYDTDYILCECPLEPLKALVEELEGEFEVTVAKEPSVCLTMIRAEDSLEKQEFFLGEALTTECEVTVDGKPGFGLCLGEEPERGYCIAVLDALLCEGAKDERIERFLREQEEAARRRDQEDYARTMSTRVDFKLMEED